MNISLFFDRELLVPVITNSFQTPDLEERSHLLSQFGYITKISDIQFCFVVSVDELCVSLCKSPLDHLAKERTQTPHSSFKGHWR